MKISKRTYQWLYDHIQSKFYNLLIKFCFFPFGGEQKCRKQFLEPVQFKLQERILDMCCGTGGVTFTIALKADSKSEITGLDLSQGQINIARKNNKLRNVQFLTGDVTSTDFAENHFHKVFISHALHEMWREERLKVLAEAKRVLQTNGELIILELDIPKNFFSRWFAWLWLFYWLPFNPETPTKNEMFRYGVLNEAIEVGFINLRKVNKIRGTFQIVLGNK